MRAWLLLTFFFVTIAMAHSQSAKSPFSWWFWPDYSLDGRAKNQIGPRIPSPQPVIEPVQIDTYPFRFFGGEPTNRLVNFVDVDSLPDKAFSVEMWINNHVNQPVGVLATLRYRQLEKDPKWLFGMHGREVVFTKEDTTSDFSVSIHHEIKERGWKNYWYHLVGSYDGQEMKLFVNGALVSQEKSDYGYTDLPKDMQMEVAGYFSKEPYMQTGDLLKNLNIYDYALSEHEVNENLLTYQQLVEEGKLYPDLFHFNAGPYLQAVSETAIGLVWETSEQANVTLHCGTSLPLTEVIQLSSTALDAEFQDKESKPIGRYVLKGLEPGQPYFYQLVATSRDGKTIDSGISTFKTAPKEIRSFSFCTIGDTEARPHVNNRVAKLMWDERPDFLVHLGDLTDGGMQDRKFQWNYEYFHGMNQLISRVPLFPVAGNGEGDLFWYKQYHIQAAEKGYYRFSYANADFFMLDSNQKDEFSPGGEQFKWLEEQLAASTAEWKFVAHHHAPYSSDEDDYGDSWSGASDGGDLAVRQIVPLYEKYGVDAVFFGHLHTYQRSHRIREEQINDQNGVLYVQAGGAGGNLEGFAPTRSWFSAKTFRGYHYLTVEVLGSQMELRMYDSEGRLKDLYNLDKSE